MSGQGAAQPRLRPGAIAAFILLVASLAACGDLDEGPLASSEGQPPAERRRVFLIGIDGASPRVVEDLLGVSRLPTLGRLAQEGSWGPLQSFFPLESPRIWTSIATGKLPAKHGIEGFQTGFGKRRRLYASGDRKVVALWNIASARGLTTGVVNWWVTHPAEVVDGVMVSDHLVPARFAGADSHSTTFDNIGEVARSAVFPPAWRDRVVRAVAADTLPVPFRDFFDEASELPDWVDREALSAILQADAAVVRAAIEIEAGLAPDLLMVFLPGIDRVSHWLWGTLEAIEPPARSPTMSQQERVAGARALRRYYEYTDALIGRLLANADSDDLVIVVSDHGFEAGRVRRHPKLTGRHSSERAQQGVVFTRGPGFGAGGRLEGVTVSDITPTILAWLGLPIAEDMDGRVAGFLERASSDAPAPVATYDDQRAERLPDSGAGADAAVSDQLRALGYIE